MKAFDSQRIVLTGISRGIGLESARRLLAEGAHILGVAKDAARLEAAVKTLDAGTRLTTVVADLSLPEAAEQLRTEVERRWGALDVLINNAGIQIDDGARGFQDVREGALEESLNVNLLAPYRLCRALLPLLGKGTAPRIVNVSSGAGNFESMRARDIPTYRLSKWALNGFTMLLAEELRGKVQVNAFDPGWVKTELGGPNAPGLPSESAAALLTLLATPLTTSGKFFKDGNEIAW